jgi:hypothetical protein
MNKKSGITWWELNLGHLAVVKAFCEPMLSLAVINSVWIPTDNFWRQLTQFPNLSVYRIRAPLLLAQLWQPVFFIFASLCLCKKSADHIMIATFPTPQIRWPHTRYLFANFEPTLFRNTNDNILFQKCRTAMKWT